MTTQEFVAAFGMTVACQYSGRNKKDNWEHFAWGCTISLKDSKTTFQIPYHCGLAHQGFKKYNPITGKHTEEYRRANSGEIKEYDINIKCGIFQARKLVPIPPKVEDVLLSISLDCQCIDNSRCFESWASELGYETDSIKALKIYEASLKQYHELKHFFGANFHTFLNLTEE